MTTSPRRFELTVLPERFAISQLAADAPIPEWATQGSFFSVTRTQDEATFDTDYLLIASETLSTALNALEGAGHKIHRS